MDDQYTGSEIAIISMACKFPEANSPESFWENLRNGKCAVKFMDDHELDPSVPAHLQKHPDYVKASIPLQSPELFDSAFFGFNPKEAALMDPQHRLFLEICWEAMERAGHPLLNNDRVGVFGGCAASSYIMQIMQTVPEVFQDLDFFQYSFLNDKDYFTTRVSYKLGLSGPSVGIQTACSSSLVAVHYACQSLLIGECDMALAGGSSIRFPQNLGYLYKKGQILSPDGYCRPFDQQANGTIFGNGVGVVLLKRLADALDDNDHILGVIKGSAINNDGIQKIGYTAPSVKGQRTVIQEAMGMAEVTPEQIGYVEAHGTATALGDPIEIEALTAAYQELASTSPHCPIGSVKSNIGHLDGAAGIAGLIKCVLMLQHAEVPPTLHYQQANSAINFDQTPFHVNNELLKWTKQADTQRHAAVSSFGIGGTNAHVVLGEAPSKVNHPQNHSTSLVVLSAKTPSALEKSCTNLIAHLQSHPEQTLMEIAYTLQKGRTPFSYRYSFVAKNHEEAIAQLLLLQQTNKAQLAALKKEVVWVMEEDVAKLQAFAHQWYGKIPQFTQCIDQAETYLARQQFSLKKYIDGNTQTVSITSQETHLLQFVTHYAFGSFLVSLGIRPHYIQGNTLGKLVGACLAQVLSLEASIQLLIEHLHDAVETTFQAQAIQEALQKHQLNSNYFLEAPAVAIQRQEIITISPHYFEKLDHWDEVAKWQLIGHVWQQGGAIDWEQIYHQDKIYRVPLPTYPFEYGHFGIDTIKQFAAEQQAPLAQNRTLYTKTAYEQPETGLEEQMANKLCQILGYDQIGRKDDLFELGLDSLNMTQFTNWLHQNYKVTLELEDILELATIEEIAAHTTEQLTELLNQMSEEEVEKILQLF
ncbi:MAG: beta-ketoacyl synthase N-terminal-like domain-containing protein [Flammeovirgaceae bacterium]